MLVLWLIVSAGVGLSSLIMASLNTMLRCKVIIKTYFTSLWCYIIHHSFVFNSNNIVDYI